MRRSNSRSRRRHDVRHVEAVADAAVEGERSAAQRGADRIARAGGAMEASTAPAKPTESAESRSEVPPATVAAAAMPQPSHQAHPQPRSPAERKCIQSQRKQAARAIPSSLMKVLVGRVHIQTGFRWRRRGDRSARQQERLPASTACASSAPAAPIEGSTAARWPATRLGRWPGASPTGKKILEEEDIASRRSFDASIGLGQ